LAHASSDENRSRNSLQVRGYSRPGTGIMAQPI
jgi:hypothetical protein